ncbi:MAG: xre family DNA-binding domain and TPR-repeat-containing protein [Bacilli bacterium]|nr:xre family DNA-binding domain and TPR-repeat-containing protein [Bacilli bacterium]
MGIGRKIRRRRKELGLTQSEVAAAITSASTISLIETEKLSPKMEIVKLLAERLNTSIDDLMDNEMKEDDKLLGEWMEKIEHSICEMRLEEAMEQLHLLQGTDSVVNHSTAKQMIELFTTQIELEEGNHQQAQDRLTQFEEKWLPVDGLPKVNALYLFIKAAYLIDEGWHEHAFNCLEQLKEIKQSLPLLYMPHFLILYARCVAERRDCLTSYKHLHEAKQHLVNKGRWIELCKAKIVKSTIDQLFEYTSDAYNELMATEQLLIFKGECGLLNLVYYNLGRIAHKRGLLQEAIESFAKCMQVVQVPSGRLTADVELALAQIFFEQDRLTKALEYANKAMSNSYNFTIRCNIYLLIAEIKRHEKKNDEQQQALLEARKSALDSRNKWLNKKCNESLGHFYYEKGDYQKSSFYLIKASTFTEQEF